MSDGEGALAGLRVIDFTQVLAGPFCTQLLADQGAEVIKIEPLKGDETRSLGPFRPDDPDRHYGGYFQSVNRNKLGLALDLKQPQGREIALRLIDGADVVVENYRPGVMDRLGLAYETLAARNPRLVYAAISGFGNARTGASPYATWPALDVVAQAIGGIMSITGEAADRPLKVGPGVGDIFPGALAAFGILAAVHHAQRTGVGQFMDVAMVDGVLALCERIVHQHGYAGSVPQPEGNQHPILCPYGLFRTADGWIAIAAHSEPFWTALSEAMGRPELATDPRFRTNGARLAHREETYAFVNGFLNPRPTAEIVALLKEKMPIGPVQTIRDIFADPHFAAREMLVEVEHPGLDTPVVVAGVPIRMTRTQGRIRRRAPLLGEHSDAILGELGVDPEEIGRLRAAGVLAPTMELEP